jgi:hypothetical protein
MTYALFVIKIINLKFLKLYVGSPLFQIALFMWMEITLNVQVVWLDMKKLIQQNAEKS